jgi:plastocyanin
MIIMKTPFFRHQRALLLIPAFLFAAFFNSGCSKSTGNGPTPGTNEVWMQNTAFNPSTINVSVNATVKWTNKDGFDHSVEANDKSFGSGNMGPGVTYTHQFTTAGTYQYNCPIHPGMNGTVVVK